jgi:phage terminase large subunit-like protein
MRKVFFPTFASWWPKAENELLTFPVGKHDEFPDVLGVIGRYLDGLGKPVKKTEKKVENAFTMAWLKKAQARRELEIDSLMSY